MIVDLSRSWMLRAIRIGVERQEYADRMGKQAWRGRERGGMRAFDAVISAVGECAVAKLLHVPWPCRSVEDDYKGAHDVGDVEVRTRRVPGSGSDLGIKQGDTDDSPFVLAHFLARTSVIDVVGWMYAKEVKQPHLWHELSGCFYKPPPYRSVDELIQKFGRQEAA